MKTVECGCGRILRPCNLARHVRARHAPSIEEREFGAMVMAPANPIRIGKRHDRRYDDFVPRGEGPHRYRIYRLRAGDLELLATAPLAENMGLALKTLHEEGEFIGDDSVGILDTIEDPGHWVANPFTLGRKAHE